MNIENSRIILFDNFAAIMKYCSESVSMGVLVAIGSGWSIVRNNNMIKGITLGALVGIFNIISSIYLSYWN